MGKEHGDLITEIIENVNRSGGAWVWRNQCGLFKSPDGKRWISVGLKGSADITGLNKNGVRIEIEVKVGRDKQQLEQQQFECAVVAMGGKYCLVKSVEEALDFVKFSLRSPGC